MHYSKVLIAAAAVFFQEGVAVRILAYTGKDCTGLVQDLGIDHNAACDQSTNQFQSYKENGWGKANGQRIGFYKDPGCADDSFLFDTYSNDGDYFHSHQCYNIREHSPSKFAQGARLY